MQVCCDSHCKDIALYIFLFLNGKISMDNYQMSIFLPFSVLILMFVNLVGI